jgi:hypothetical protein
MMPREQGMGPERKDQNVAASNRQGEEKLSLEEQVMNVANDDIQKGQGTGYDP